MTTLRLAHISDSHFDEHGDVEDQVAVHRAFVEQAAAADVHAIVHAGDLFERASTPRERLMLADFLQKAATVAPVFGVKGNHDRNLELDLFPLLGGDAYRSVMFADKPQSIIGGWNFGFAFLAVPWFDKAPIAAGVDAAAGREASRIATQEQARALLLGMSAHASDARARGEVPVLVAHAMVGGSVMSTGQVLLGVGVEVSVADLLLSGAEYVALGHVHKHQEWAGGRVAYSGSPRRCNHGEPEQKGWRLVTFEDGRFAGAEFRRLPARELFHADLDLTADQRSPVAILQRLWRGADWSQKPRVRVRYKVAARDLPHVDTGGLQRALMELGAYDVQLEAQVVPEVRARVPELVTQPDTTPPTLAERVGIYLRQSGASLERWSQIEAKLGEIGGEL